MDEQARQLEKRMHDQAVEDMAFQSTHSSAAYADRMATRWIEGLRGSTNKGLYFERVVKHQG